MGNPFFLPDIQAHSPSDADTRRHGRFVSVAVLLLCSVWVALSFVAILLTLSDAMSAGASPASVIVELE